MKVTWWPRSSTNRYLRLLAKLRKAQRIGPKFYILRPESPDARIFRDRGGFPEVSYRKYQEFSVAIKAFEVRFVNLIRSRCSTIDQRFCGEIVGWKHSSHPNILPLLGLSVSARPSLFPCQLLADIPNGNLIRYTQSNPKESCSDSFGSSLCYFHSGYVFPTVLPRMGHAPRQHEPQRVHLLV